MNYDFETLIDRRHQGSVKFERAFGENPNLPEGTIPLSMADMEFKNAPEIVEGLKVYLDEMILGYTCANQSYKDAVRGWMKRRKNFDVKDEWMVETTGVIPAIFNAVKCLTKENDGVIVFSPVYYPFFASIIRQGRTLVDVPLIEKDGRFEIDFEKFEEVAKNSNNKVLLFCSPHNPVGRVWTKEELERIEKIVLENDLYLICDEIHSDIILPRNKHIVFQTLSEELADRSITFTSASKTFNLAGMGVATTVIKNEKIRSAYKDKAEDVHSFANSALGFKATEIAYNKCEEWLNQFIDKIVQNQKIVREVLKDTKIGVINPEGTYLILLDFRKTGLNREEREKKLSDECAVIFDHGHIFGQNADGLERLNLAAPSRIIREAMERLKDKF